MLYPAVPPWLASQNASIPPTAKIIDEMWTHIRLANGASVFSATGHFADPVAAMPSLHAAYPMLLMLFFWKSAGRCRWLLALYPLAMAFTLVYTGEHFVIDIIFGWLYADHDLRARQPTVRPLRSQTHKQDDASHLPNSRGHRHAQLSHALNRNGRQG